MRQDAERGERDLGRGGAVVFRGEDFRVVGVDGVCLAVHVLSAEAREFDNLGAAVSPSYPLAGCPPLEEGGLGGVRERLAGPRSASTFTPLSTVGVSVVVIASLLF